MVARGTWQAHSARLISGVLFAGLAALFAYFATGRPSALVGVLAYPAGLVLIYGFDMIRRLPQLRQSSVRVIKHHRAGPEVACRPEGATGQPDEESPEQAAAQKEADYLAYGHVVTVCYPRRLRRPASQAEYPLCRRSPLAPFEEAPCDIADSKRDDEQRQPEDNADSYPRAGREPRVLRQGKPRCRVEVHPRWHRSQTKLSVFGSDRWRFCHLGPISVR